MTTWQPPHRIAIAAAQQTWESVAFVHWRYPAAVIDGLLPPSVEVDTIDGTAWVSLTPFRMQAGVLPLVARPAVATAEINVRTYVPVRSMPGIWFLSLELDEPMVGSVLRGILCLPYRTSEITVEHRPRPLRRAEISEVSGELLAAVDLPPPEGQPDVRFSDGVHARLGLPRPTFSTNT